MLGSIETMNRMSSSMDADLSTGRFTGERHLYHLPHSPFSTEDVTARKGPGVHALHYLLSAITCGKVTVEDLRRAFVAKKRKISARRSFSSNLAGCALEGKLQGTLVIQEESRPAGETSQAVRNADAVVAYSGTDKRPSCFALDTILQRWHLYCVQHGLVLYRRSLTGLFVRPLEVYCARKAVEDGPAMYPAASPAACLADILLGDGASTLHGSCGAFVRCDGKNKQWGGVHFVLYDEEKLLGSLQLLNLRPFHAIHLCFWAASRILLSQPLHNALDLSRFLLLLEAAIPIVSSVFGRERADSEEKAALHSAAGSLSVAEAERLAAVHYMKQVIAIPFFRWWNYLINELSDSSECGGQETRGTKKPGAQTKPGQLACAGSVGHRGEMRTRSVLRSRSGRQWRVEAWQSLLSRVVSHGVASSSDASSLDASPGAAMMAGESAMLCSLLLSPGRLHDEPKEHKRMTCKSPSECSKPFQAAECLRGLASLLHMRELLTIQFIFVDPTPFDRAAEYDGRLSFPDCWDKQESLRECQIQSSPPTACLHVGHNDISAWLTWVLQRLMKFPASALQ